MSQAFSRRAGLMLAAALIVASASPAFAEGKPNPATKVFPFLDKFLKVPPAERTRVRLGYVLSRDGKPLANLGATLIEKSGARTPLPVNGEGMFERLPSLAQMEAGAMVALDLPEDAKYSTSLNFGTQLKPATDYDVKELVATVDEANTVIRKAAGPAAMLAPKMAGISFHGAEGGLAVFTDGHTQPLPKVKEIVVFRPEEFSGATRVKLSKLPRKVGFAGKKK